MFRPGDKNANADYILRTVEDEKVIIVLNVGMEETVERYTHISTTAPIKVLLLKTDVTSK